MEENAGVTAKYIDGRKFNMSAALDHVQLSSIELAANRVAAILQAGKVNEKLIVARAVFDIAVGSAVFDADKLVEMAREKLTANHGWRFSQTPSRPVDSPTPFTPGF